jgi:hypothetical protein
MLELCAKRRMVSYGGSGVEEVLAQQPGKDRINRRERE